MKRAIIYTRVSSKEQVENYSLSHQLATCSSYCETQGFEVDRVFVEQGESAKTSDRTELQAMLAYCRENRHRLHAVVVYNLSRFARNRFDHHALLAHLHRLGLVLRSVTEPVDESPTGELMDGILASLHAFENRLRAQRTKAGMEEATRSGLWMWRAPLGYHHPGGRKEPMEPDPEAAPHVLWAFEQMATGQFTQEEVRKRATERGLRTSSGKPVPRQTFHRLLRQPLYMGRIVYPPWGIDVEGQHEAIVPRALYQRVQTILNGGSAAPVSRSLDHPDFPLRRLVHCGACGEPLTGSWAQGRNKRYAYYWCRTSGCRAVKMRREDLEGEFIDLLDDLRPSDAYLTLLGEEVIALWRDRELRARIETRKQQTRIERLRERKDQLVDAYVFEKAIDVDTYRRKLDELHEGIAEAEVRLADLQIEECDVDAVLAYAEGILTQASRIWVALAPEPQRRFNAAVFPDGLEYDPEEGLLNRGSGWIFRPLGEIEVGKSQVVAPTGFEPVFLP